jgi:hypothetical protein
MKIYWKSLKWVQRKLIPFLHMVLEKADLYLGAYRGKYEPRD